MSLPTIEKFLFFFEIEVAGVVLGWMSAVGFASLYCLLAGQAVYYFILGDTILPPREGWWEQLLKMLKTNWYYFAYMAYCVIMSVSGVKLIKATKNRVHAKMELFLIFTAVGVIASSVFFILLETSFLSQVVAVVVILIFHSYAFISVYSLYQKLKLSSGYQTL